MQTHGLSHGNLIQHIIGQESSLLQKLSLLVAGVLMLWLSAKIEVPFYPIPMTMQTFVVLMLGISYGVRLGGATIFSYLSLGALGLPVFAGTPEKGIGLLYMAGPTGGYLVGFLAAALVCGWLAENFKWDRNITTVLLNTVIGHAVIFACGLLWLGTVIGWDKPVLALGFTPFLFGAVVKSLLIASTLSLAWKFLDKK